MTQLWNKNKKPPEAVAFHLQQQAIHVVFCEEGVHKGIEVAIFPRVKFFKLLKPIECIVVDVLVFEPATFIWTVS